MRGWSIGGEEGGESRGLTANVTEWTDNTGRISRFAEQYQGLLQFLATELFSYKFQLKIIKIRGSQSFGKSDWKPEDDNLFRILTSLIKILKSDPSPAGV